jgi:hypothetical protein
MSCPQEFKPCSRSPDPFAASIASAVVEQSAATQEIAQSLDLVSASGGRTF